MAKNKDWEERGKLHLWVPVGAVVGLLLKLWLLVEGDWRGKWTKERTLTVKLARFWFLINDGDHQSELKKTLCYQTQHQRPG